MSKKILVVDDDLPITKGIEMVLKNAGYSTQYTLKGEEAIPLVHSFTPDLILMDVMLAGMDGREIAKELKSDGKTKAIPIIMISANHHMEKGIEKYGVDTFVSKPFSSRHLLDVVEKCLGN